jgi:DNA-binding response OmpR family regulator
VPSADVLLVEDDLVTRDELAEIFNFEGFTVVTARDGREAFEKIQRLKVKVIVLDLMLPRMNGWELAAAVREIPDLASVPILTITAVGTAHRAPGGPVFLKPLNVDSLVHAVSVYASS